MSGHRNSFAGSLLAFVAFLSGVVTTAACAQAVPVLVARPASSHLDGWCGDHAVRFQDSLENPFLLDVLSVLGPGSGWPDKGRIGIVRWYAPDAFLVQLPVSEGTWLTDATDAGAVLAIHIHGGEPAQVEQINPTTFQSWKLADPASISASVG